MSHLDKDMFDENDPKFRTFSSITLRMLLGAGVAALLFFGTLILLWFIYFVGTFLPPESKEADDPTPDSFSSFERAPETHIVV
ncbi:MAG: RC-LH1 core complex protein PufX [Pseudomonadota bacterium]